VKRYVVYVRAASEEPGRAGLEIEAQERRIDRFLETSAPQPWQVVGHFTELLSAADHDRPQLEAALALVRRTPNAELLVATLDRLSGREAFITGLLEDPQVRLRAAAMSDAGPLQVRLFAAIAERERRRLSGPPTKAAPVETESGRTKLGGVRDKAAPRGAAKPVEPTAHSLHAQVVALRSVAAPLSP
jgi:DNA invertase Pin-like site-specific DNA recombinase